ncbi:GNAT family N-acetyltransferase [Alteromonas sp. ASW11-130]|uniref:GNAT family N-acetyltransferase n=1 Tax=Alteromonas sp. ASW11-130 TaxID=3015775 RepID=UPI0022418DCC|nr:GNAT family N-acetyltransferase [Alteromonas sp. ASW11-130]MCW8090335.1 GNAT family N-acetyltransferase [Alteromonas sp. ASW11-130]
MIKVFDSAKGPVIKGYQICLRPVVESDLATLQAWRNSDAVRQQMLSTELVSSEQQQAWFNKIQRDDSQRHWVVEYKDQAIGATNIKARFHGETVEHATVLEPGLYIGHPDYQGNIIAFAPTLALYDYCFSHLSVETFFAVVKAENRAALKYNQQLGYEVIKNAELIDLNLQKEEFERHTALLRRLLSRPSSKNR